MGYGGGDVRMCYNAPKSHWLGWYSELHAYLDPVAEPSRLVELVGLADYDEAMVSGDPSSQAVVLRIDMYEGQSLCEFLLLLSHVRNRVICGIHSQGLTHPLVTDLVLV